MALIRSFIAIPFPEALCRQVAALQQELRHELPELRTVAAHNLHLTLNFLGDRSEEQLANIGRFMLSVVGSHPPFSLSLQELGTFPGGRRPRVVWLGVQPPEPVVALQQQLAAGLAELGCPEERTPYRPHLTLGRFRRPPSSSEALHARRDIVVGPLPITTVILYSSRLTPQGAVHRPLTTAGLQGR